VEQRDPLGNSRLIAPDAAGRPVGFTDALGFSSSTEYTPVDQPAASVDPLGGRTGFAYDAAGRLASVTDARGTVLERYGYDALDRLLTRTDALGKEERYAYNAGGQLTRRTDRQGRVTTYGYDGSGRLIRIEHPEGTVQQRSYDPLGRRSERRVNGQSTRYVYDGAQAIGEIREGQSTTLLTSLSIDEMLARYSAQGARRFLTDALGSVIALTREDQSVLTSYAYSPYGQSQTSGAEEGNASQYTAREAKSPASSSSVRRPRSAASSAVARPVAPPPTTSTSQGPAALRSRASAARRAASAPPGVCTARLRLPPALPP
jgi:YD repeat-containing protein